MLSNRPYLLRAFYQWIVDSACTPILVIDANNPRCKIPKDFAEGGEIVFNISSTAIRDLKMLNDSIEFKASYSGVIHIVYAPINAVLAVYAEENGEGLFFDAEEDVNGELGEAGIKLESIEGSLSHVGELDMVSEASQRAKPVLRLVE